MGEGEYWAASMYRDADGRFNVFIVQPLGKAAPEIIFQTDIGVVPHSLRWSPDGQYLFFTVYDRESELTQAIYLYDRTNRQLKSFDVQQMTGTQGRVWQADWSPQALSRQLAFTLCLPMDAFECTLWLADMAGGTAALLKAQREAWLWDPAGKSLIFEGNFGAAISFDVQTLTEEELPFNRSQVSQGARVLGFFPNLDGRLIKLPNDDTWSYFLISEDGTQETLLFQTPQDWGGELFQPPMLSPNGRQIGLNFYFPTDQPAFMAGSLDHLPLTAPTEPDPKRGLLLLWSPDERIQVTLVGEAQRSDGGGFSLGFYDAQTGDLLNSYQPPAPFDLFAWLGSSSFGDIQHYYFSTFDTVWIP
jgi:hypothetical protein